MHIPKTRITNDEEKAVKLLREKGLEVEDIVTATGISRTSVFRILEPKTVTQATETIDDVMFSQINELHITLGKMLETLERIENMLR